MIRDLWSTKVGRRLSPVASGSSGNPLSSLVLVVVEVCWAVEVGWAEAALDVSLGVLIVASVSQ